MVILNEIGNIKNFLNYSLIYAVSCRCNDIAYSIKNIALIEHLVLTRIYELAILSKGKYYNSEEFLLCSKNKQK